MHVLSDAGPIKRQKINEKYKTYPCGPISELFWPFEQKRHKKEIYRSKNIKQICTYTLR